MGEQDELSFEWLDRTRWHHTGRKKSPQMYFSDATLRLSPLPECEGMSRQEVCDFGAGLGSSGRARRG